MKKLRFLVIATVLAAAMSPAHALGKLNFLNLLRDQLTQSKTALAVPAQSVNVDAALTILATAPGVGEFDNIAPDLTVASKAVAALGPAGADPAVANAVNSFLPGASANVTGRLFQAVGVTPPSFGLTKKVAKIQGGLEKAGTSTKLTPAKKLKKFAGFGKKADAIYNKNK